MYTTTITKAENLKIDLKKISIEGTGTIKTELADHIEAISRLIEFLKNNAAADENEKRQIAENQTIQILTTNSNPFMTTDDLNAPNNHRLIELCIEYVQDKGALELGKLITCCREGEANGTIRNKYAYLTQILKTMLKR